MTAPTRDQESSHSADSKGLPAGDPPGGAWQPRETAPDTQVFRAYGPTLIHPDFNPQGSVEACWDGERFIGAVWDGQFDCWNTVEIEFTHWMPLPAAPVPDETKG